MEISGKIVAILPIATGEGRNGVWRSQDYVLETMEQYSRKICFNLFGDKIDLYPLALNDEVTVSIDIDSREYNGRWYTNIRAWKVEKKENNIGGQSASFDTPPPPSFEDLPHDEGNDLPF
ncbi:MAG: DUF3127 domain-containing protein [Prevotellaceae bacterium]|jgi:hypothetical protein|nr:DUF3127 domain-containing protein [Prevotellaceae bacterium]